MMGDYSVCVCRLFNLNDDVFYLIQMPLRYWVGVGAGTCLFI